MMNLPHTRMTQSTFIISSTEALAKELQNSSLAEGVKEGLGYGQ